MIIIIMIIIIIITEDRKEKIEVICTKGRQHFILGHGRWLDEKPEGPGDNIKCRVKMNQ